MMEGCEIRAVIDSPGGSSYPSLKNSVRIPIDKDCVPPSMARHCRRVVSQETWRGILQAFSDASNLAEEPTVLDHATIREVTDEEA